MKVMKFGGSTIKNPKMIKKVGEIIQAEEKEKVVVVSALYGQTNEIREYITNVRTEKNEIDDFIAKIRSKHNSMALGVIPDKKISMKVMRILNNHLEKLERLLYGVAYT
ncbi:MAG: hypothetical protein JSV49_04835, partial [Thermoplasmata archaeon]